ncbi:MAG: CRISPR-associated endonuclease Cas2 [Candidatus Wallbacteria bacterium]|nr:CRISPR-associated endonuclease Cas2 [Candidatus Wallbacteria bacterium]
MFYIVCYDTPSNRRRTRLARALKDYAARVQWSVFETHLPADVYAKMLQRLAKIVDLAEDTLRIYPVPADSLAKVKLFGRPDITKVDEFYWVGRNR